MVDISGSCTADQARLPIRVIERFGIHWIEEPLDWAGYRWLRDRSAEPIATGEALCTAHQVNRLGVAGCADISQPGLSLCSGLSQGRLIAWLADLDQKRLSPHPWGSGIGLAAALHLVAAHAPTRRRRALPMRPSWNLTSPTIRCGTSSSPTRLSRSTASSPFPMARAPESRSARRRCSASPPNSDRSGQDPRGQHPIVPTGGTDA